MVREVDLSAVIDLIGSVDTLRKKNGERVAPQSRKEFERRSTTNIDELARQIAIDVYERIKKIIAETKACYNGGWAVAKPEWRQLLEQAQALVRDCELAVPTSSENLQANLRWMVEHGRENNLPLLKELQKNPPYHSDIISTLIDMAIQQIEHRSKAIEAVDSLATAMRKGEEAYHQHKDEWDKTYAGKYIAIHQGEVICSNTDKRQLMRGIIKQQREKGPFRACVLKIHSQIDL
jgi:hypothetical protein